MGLLDSVIGALAGGQGGAGPQGAGQGTLINIVMGMLANRQADASQGGAAGGGLGDLMAKFQQGGLGDVIGSWIGTGQNLPVSADQLSNVLGSDMLANIARQLGVSHGEAASQLSQVLPQVVDKLTPNGQVPEGGLGDIGAILGRFGQR